MSTYNTQRPEDWYKKSGFPNASDAGSWDGDSSDTVIPQLADAGCSTHKPPPRAAGFQGSDLKKRRRTKIVSLSVCALLLVAAMGFAAWKIAELFPKTRADSASSVPSQVLVPNTQDSDEYGDYQDYFENVYTASANVEIPQAELGTGVTLQLQPQPEQELTLQEIYAKVSPAVVGVTVYLDDIPRSWGTGVVFTEDGYIITNTHVLQGGTSAEVTFSDGTVYEALLVGADDTSDIAVLRVEAEGLPCAEFGDSNELLVGDEAVAIGNPLGAAYSGTMTNGIISAIDRNLVNNGHSMTLLQTNAALNEGNSGGPLINAYGQVVGITNMKIMSTYYTTVEGIGFAIPSTVVKQVADELIESGVVSGEPTIGIVAGAVGTEAMELYDLPAGVYVSEVNDGSDAKEQGMQPGDIILEVNGTAVSTVSEVNAIKEGYAVGDTLDLLIYRDGDTFTVTVKLVDKADIG